MSEIPTSPQVWDFFFFALSSHRFPFCSQQLGMVPSSWAGSGRLALPLLGTGSMWEPSRAIGLPPHPASLCSGIDPTWDTVALVQHWGQLEAGGSFCKRQRAVGVGTVSPCVMHGVIRDSPAADVQRWASCWGPGAMRDG